MYVLVVMKFHCTHCGQSIDAPDELMGAEANCPTCEGEITVPTSVIERELPKQPEEEQNTLRQQAELASKSAPEKPVKKLPDWAMNQKVIITGIGAGLIVAILCFLLISHRVDKTNEETVSEKAPAKEAVEKEVTGEVFMLNADKTSRRLAGIKVQIFDRKILEAIIAEVRKVSPKAPAAIDDVIKSVQNQLNVASRIHKEEMDRMTKSADVLLTASYNEMNAKLSLRYYNNAKENWPPANLFFEAFNSPQYETYTNADGRFSFMLPEGDWVIVVDVTWNESTDKEVGGHTYWTIPVNNQTNISLGPHNHLLSDPNSSVLKVGMGFFESNYAAILQKQLEERRSTWKYK